MVLRGELLTKPTYPVILSIHEGSTGLCYKVWHDIFDCWKVQKTVSLAGLDDALARQEPALLHELNHRYLSDVHEAQWDPSMGPSCITFVMPYYEGGSLHNVMQGDQSISLGSAIRICSNVAEALHYLHVERSLLHRDVKPGNIFLSGALSTAYLGDLGSAATAVGGSAEFRGGTPLYRAPEYRTNRYTAGSDLYSLGLVLLEMVNGPFDYAGIDFDEVERRLDEGRCALPARLLAVAPHVPDSLRRIIGNLLEPDPRRRTAAASDLLRKLNDVVHLDWREVPVDVGRMWLGTAQPSARLRPPREVRATAFPITGGRYSGLVELSAQWRNVGVDRWRTLAAQRSRVQPGDQQSWRSFFKSVSTAMLQSIARR